MTLRQQARRQFVKQIGIGFAALALPSPLAAFARTTMIDDTFYNYEEALKTPLKVKSLAFSFDNSYHPYTKSLPDARIKTLVNLEELFINGYKASHMKLPVEISELKQLQKVTIYADNLVEIPPVIWTLKSLTSLMIEINSLKENDLRLSDFPSLDEFGIKLHKTQNLPAAVFSNSNLKWLYIQSDDLKVIPNQFNKLPDLSYLTLHCQYVSDIPNSISTLSKLKRLDLYNKTTTSLDIDFSGLDSLEEFRWGQALFFPTSLTTAKKLKRATFDVSYFEAINADSLPFQNLKILDISFSKLKRIPKCFETLHAVEGLYLAYNNFDTIEFDFSQLTQLKTLSFRECGNFEKIDMKKFISSLTTIKNLSSLETPILSKEQSLIKKDNKYKFDWAEN
jgi:Leucine-rich repeat (LRR) protein